MTEDYFSTDYDALNYGILLPIRKSNGIGMDIDMEMVKPAATVGIVAAAAIVTLAVSFARLVKAKGLRDSVLWLPFVPMPFTKAMYMLILSMMAVNSERPFPGVWLWGAALVFAVVIGLQWGIASRRIGGDLIADISPEAPREAPWWAGHVRGNLPIKMLVPFIMCSIIETVAVFALVAALIFGQSGMNAAGECSRAETVRRLKEISMPEVAFHAPQTMNEFAKYMSQATRDFDVSDLPVERRGIKFICKGSVAAKAGPKRPMQNRPLMVGDSLSSTTAWDVLTNVCNSVDCKFEIYPGEVVIWE